MTRDVACRFLSEEFDCFTSIAGGILLDFEFVLGLAFLFLVMDAVMVYCCVLQGSND